MCVCVCVRVLENDGPPSLEWVQRWKLAKANKDEFQHL